MATEISLDLINQLKLSLRKEANLSSYDPTDSSLPKLPTAAEAIEELDPCASYLRCRNCKGKLLQGIESLICVFCGKQQRSSENPPDPIKFTSTVGYKWFLGALNLDGSEIVEPVKDVKESSRVAKGPVDKGIAVSKFLDLEIHWSEIEEKAENSGEDKNPLNLGGVSVDDFFVEGRGDVSKVETVESSKSVEDDFSDPRSLSLFDGVKSQGVVESKQNENVGLFQGNDAQKSVSSGEQENLSLFSGQDAKDSVSVAEQGNFGFFEEKDAQGSIKEDGNLSLFDGKDAQQTSSSKDDERFGFFEGNDAQRNSSSKDDENFGFFEGKDAQRNSSSKDDENFGFFEGKEAQRNSSSKESESFGIFEGKDAQRNSPYKEDESFGFFESKDAQRNSSSKEDESFGFFEGKDVQRNSSSKDDENFGFFEGKDVHRNSSSKEDESFGLFEGAPSSNAALHSFDDKVVASSSDWESDFQSADRNLSQKKTGGDPFVSSPVDLSAHMDSVFGSGKDLLYVEPADSSTAYVSKGGDWLQDDLFGNVTSETQNKESAVSDKNEGQFVGGNASSSMDIDWIGDDLWQSNEKKTPEDNNDLWQSNEKKTPEDNNDDDDDWNDFEGSANSKAPNNPIFDGLAQGKNDVKEQSENENRNTGISMMPDVGKVQEDDLFGSWENNFTSSTTSQSPLQPLTDHVKPSGEQNSEMNLFGENNNPRGLSSDFFSESISGQTNSDEVKAVPSGTSTLERSKDPDGEELVGTTAIAPKSKSEIAEELMSQMHDLSFMLDTNLSVPPASKTE